MKRQNGEWVVTDQDNPTEVKFFGEDGRWTRTVGRRGAGPGEFQQAWGLHVLPDDGLLAFDAGLRRITGFDPGLTPMGTQPVRVPATSIAFLGSGEVVVGARLNGPSEVGLPLHLLDASGTVVRSFGADPPIQEWGNPSKVRRTIAPSSDGGVWAAQRTAYVLEHWTKDGRRTASFSCDVPWYQPHDRFGRRSDRTVPPNPGIYAVFEDTVGMVWLAIRVPDENWVDAYERARDPYGGERWIAKVL